MSKMHNFRKFEHFPHCFISCASAFTSSYTHSHALTRIHLYSLGFTFTYVHSFALTFIHVHPHALTCTHMYSFALTCIHSHSHVLTCTHMHSHAFTCLVCWSLTSLCHSNGHIETMPAREINPFTALTRIRSQFLRTQ